MSDKNEPVSFEYRLDALLEGDGAGTYVQYRDGRWTRRYGPNSNPRTRCYDGFGKTEEERKGETTHIEVNERDLYEAMTVARREYENSYARLRNLEKLIHHIPLVKDRHRRGLNEPHLDGFDTRPTLKSSETTKNDCKRSLTRVELYEVISEQFSDDASQKDVLEALAEDGYIDLDDYWSREEAIELFEAYVGGWFNG